MEIPKNAVCWDCGSKITKIDTNPDDPREQIFYCPKCQRWAHGCSFKIGINNSPRKKKRKGESKKKKNMSLWNRIIDKELKFKLKDFLLLFFGAIATGGITTIMDPNMAWVYFGLLIVVVMIRISDEMDKEKKKK